MSGKDDPEIQILKKAFTLLEGKSLDFAASK